MHCEPKRSAASRTNSGLVIAGGVDADFIGTGVEQAANVIHRAYAAAHRERDEHLAGHALHRVIGSGAIVAAGGDVEKSDLVRALLVVAARNFHRITRIANVHKLHAFHHAAVVDIEAGDDAFGEGHGEVPAVEKRGCMVALRRRLSPC
jgi:hypothetical protein